MPDDTIRAALEAAAVVLVAEGMQAIMPNEPGLRDHWMMQPANAESRRQAAAAVAAFHRQAADLLAVTGNARGAATHRAIAAAVEAAATERDAQEAMRDG